MTLSFVLVIIGMCFAAFLIYREFRKVIDISKAEYHMARLLHVQMKQGELESLRDELLRVKDEAIRVRFNDMDRIYAIERQMNLIAAKLDAESRRLIDEGLRQSSEVGRINYMLKLLDKGIQIA